MTRHAYCTGTARRYAYLGNTGVVADRPLFSTFNLNSAPSQKMICYAYQQIYWECLQIIIFFLLMSWWTSSWFFPFRPPFFFSHFSPSLLLPLATIAGKKLPFFSHFVLLLLDDGPAPAIFYLVGKRTTTMHNEIISVRHSIVCPHCRNNK